MINLTRLFGPVPVRLPFGQRFCYQLNQGNNKDLLYQEPCEEPRDQTINGTISIQQETVINLTDCPQAMQTRGP